MGVTGAWWFLEDRVGVVQFNDPQHKSGAHLHKTIHVDLVGAFYNSIRQNFLNAPKHGKKRQKISAACRLLSNIETVVNKRRCILYFDGKPTLERDFAHGKRLEKLLDIQEQLDKEIVQYNESQTDERRKTIMKLARQLFRVYPDILNVIYKSAVQRGWNVVVAQGEAEVEIGKVGGIVLTQDSDMLFYPKIDTVICPFLDTFRFYKKSTIFRKLGLSSEFFTVMGIVAKNDYDEDFYAGEKSENDRDFYMNRMADIYNELVDIKKESFNVEDVSGNSLIRAIIKTYVSSMNAKTGKEISVDAYERSYSIFVMQEQQLSDSNESRYHKINRPALYLAKISRD